MTMKCLCRRLSNETWCTIRNSPTTSVKGSQQVTWRTRVKDFSKMRELVKLGEEKKKVWERLDLTGCIQKGQNKNSQSHVWKSTFFALTNYFIQSIVSLHEYADRGYLGSRGSELRKYKNVVLLTSLRIALAFFGFNESSQTEWKPEIALTGTQW